VAEKEIKGAAYSLCEFNGKLLASVNSAVSSVICAACIVFEMTYIVLSGTLLYCIILLCLNPPFLKVFPSIAV